MAYTCCGVGLLINVLTVCHIVTQIPCSVLTRHSHFTSSHHVNRNLKPEWSHSPGTGFATRHWWPSSVSPYIGTLVISRYTDSTIRNYGRRKTITYRVQQCCCIHVLLNYIIRETNTYLYIRHNILHTQGSKFDFHELMFRVWSTSSSSLIGLEFEYVKNTTTLNSYNFSQRKKN